MGISLIDPNVVSNHVNWSCSWPKSKNARTNPYNFYFFCL